MRVWQRHHRVAIAFWFIRNELLSDFHSTLESTIRHPSTYTSFGKHTRLQPFHISKNLRSFFLAVSRLGLKFPRRQSGAECKQFRPLATMLTLSSDETHSAVNQSEFDGEPGGSRSSWVARRDGGWGASGRRSTPLPRTRLLLSRFPILKTPPNVFPT